MKLQMERMYAPVRHPRITSQDWGKEERKWIVPSFVLCVGKKIKASNSSSLHPPTKEEEEQEEEEERKAKTKPIRSRPSDLCNL